MGRSAFQETDYRWFSSYRDLTYYHCPTLCLYSLVVHGPVQIAQSNAPVLLGRPPVRLSTVETILSVKSRMASPAATAKMDSYSMTTSASGVRKSFLSSWKLVKMNVYYAMAEWIGPWSLMQKFSGLNLCTCYGKVPWGKTLHPHFLALRKESYLSPGYFQQACCLSSQTIHVTLIQPT